MRAALLALFAFVLGAACAPEGGDDDDMMMEADADPAAPDAGPAAFLDECPMGDECAPGLVCYEFNAKGPHCTHACTTAADCEAPSPGCNGMGMCKVP